MASFRALGDLSTNFLLSRQTYTLKAEVQRRSTELSSGQTADLSRALRGDYRALGAVTRGLALAETERLTIAEARGFATAAQAALGVVQDQTEALTSVLLAVPHAPTLPTLARAGSTARQGFEAVVGVLNQRTADRAIFAGDATDAAALAPVDAMLAELEALVASETSAAGVVAAVDAWFDTPGAGFELTGFTGSGSPLAPFRLGAGETADLAVTAADPGLRGMLKGFALGALLDGPTLAGDVAGREGLARAAAHRTLAATDRITGLRAGFGAAEAAIEAASVRREAETASLELARSELIGADPFEAATRLEVAQTQLETLYALTARVSRLSLVDFLR